MALNLVRNSKVFFTTNVDASTGVIKPSSSTAYSATNTQEIQVLDGFTFSQNTNTETVTLSEAGVAPTRGQRNFNTSLAPVDFSFSTYIRPRNQTTKITAEEAVLWNALLSDTAVGSTAITGATTLTCSATGLVTIAGTGMTPLPTVADIVTLSGVKTTTPTGVVTGSATGYEKLLNSAGTVATSTATSITIQLFNFPTVAVTATTLETAGIKYTKSSWAESNITFSQATSGTSDKNQLQKFGMLFLVDNVMYAVDNCALNQVTVDFGLDAIATAQWTGQATALRQFSTAVTATGGTFSGGTTTDVGSAGAYQVKDTSAAYITNKLSTIQLAATKAIGTSVTAGDSYVIPITGGSFTINNNITYITPANLGTVNSPVTYYTGTRAVSGTLNAYLRTGTVKETGELLADLLAEAATTIEPMFSLAVNIGGTITATAGPKVVLDMPAVSLGIPTIDVQQVVSTAINFTAQGYVPNATAANTVFDLTKPNDIAVRYYA